MGRSRRDPSSYDIGYGKPPEATRFKPGRSGNPRGRPKGSRPVGAILQDVVQQKIAVTEHGRTRKISVLEVMVRRLANDAMRSDARALKLLLSLLDRFQDAGETTIDLGALMAEDAAILQHYASSGQGIPGSQSIPGSNGIPGSEADAATPDALGLHTDDHDR